MFVIKQSISFHVRPTADGVYQHGSRLIIIVVNNND